MAKRLVASAAIVLAAAACQTQQNQPQPDVWTTNYNVPFDSMVVCLAAPPAGAYQVYAPGYPEAGMARIVFIPANTPQARSEYVVLRMVGNVSQVSWKRFGSIRGLDWFDGVARQRADACAASL